MAVTGSALRQAQIDVGWLGRHWVTIMGFGAGLSAVVVGVTAFNTVANDIVNNRDRVIGVETSLFKMVDAEDSINQGLTRSVTGIGEKVDDVGTQVQVLANEVENQTDGQVQIQDDVRDIRNLLQRYLVAPTNRQPFD